MNDLPLPPNHFFRVSTLFGVGQLELRKRTFFGLFSKHIAGTWLIEGTTQDILETGTFLLEEYYKAREYAYNIYNSTGDYTSLESF